MIKKIFTVLIIVISSQYSLFAWDAGKVKKSIQKAESYISEIESNIHLKEFIPYEYYSSAVVNIRNARNELLKKEYNVAYFYSEVAYIKLKAAYYFAKARKIRFDEIVYERDHYKNNKKYLDNRASDSNLRYIIEANLFKKNNIFKIEFLDKEIFTGSRLRISSHGKLLIDRIIKVLTAYKKCRVKLVGHSGFNDFKKISGYKARIIKRYMTEKGIDPDRIDAFGAGNRIVMKTPLGYRRINRIEIIVSGIEIK